MTIYRVSFDVAEIKLTTVISLLSKEVKNLVIRDTATIQNSAQPKQTLQEPAQPKARKPYTKRKKWLVGEMIDHMRDAGVKPGDKIPYYKFEEMLVRRGYKATSRSPTVTLLAQMGYFERVDAQAMRCIKALPLKEATAEQV